MLKLRKIILLGLFFLFLTVFSLKSIIFKPGIIGHIWDWDMPLFPQQFFYGVMSNLFVWTNNNLGGFFKPLLADLPYWLLILPFSFLGGAFISKLIPFIILILSFVNMFLLGRKIFKLSLFWIIVSAVFYSLSPIAYSRLIAGHLTFFLSYATLPLFSLVLFRLFDIPEKWTLKDQFKKTLSLIIIFPFLTLHYNMAILTALIFGLFFLYFLFIKQNKKKVCLTFLFSCLAFLLAESFLVLPLAYSFANKDVQLKAYDDITDKGVLLATRKDYLIQHSQPLINIITLNFSNDLYTEFVYPFPDYIKPFYIIIVLLVFALSFSSLFIFKKNKKVVFFFLILCLGVILSCGTKTFIGNFIYQLLFSLFPSIGAGFVNALRFLPLVFLSLAILSAVVLQSIENKLDDINKKILKTVVIICLIIFFYPWFFRSLTKPLYEQGSQPLSLKINKIDPEEKKVFDYIASFPEDFRITFLPPYFISWPGFTEYSYNWNVFHYSKPVFLEGTHPFLAKEIVKSLYSIKPNYNISRLLGLATVRIVVYPYYEQFDAYQNFIPGELNYKPIINRNLENQLGLEAKKNKWQTVDIYENKDFLPHFYIPLNLIISNDDQTILSLITARDDYQIRSAFFLNNDKAEPKLDVSNADQIILRAKTKVANGAYNQDEVEFEFMADQPGEYDIFLVKDNQWDKVRTQEFKQGNNTISLPFKDKYSLSSSNCQRLSDKSELIGCSIINYNPFTAYKFDFTYTLTNGRAGFAIVENTPEKQQELIKQELKATLTSKPQQASFLVSSGAEANFGQLFLFGEFGGSNAGINFQDIKVEQIPIPLAIYKGKSKDPELGNQKIPQIIFQRLNPTKYKVQVKDAAAPFVLVFSESYHNDWKVFKTKQGDSKINNKNEEIASYFNGEIKENKHKLSLIDSHLFDTWRKKPLANDRHYQVNGFSNAWHITPEDVNGQQDYELTIEFIPQRVYFIGLTISAITISSSLIFLFYRSIIKIKKHVSKA